MTSCGSAPKSTSPSPATIFRLIETAPHSVLIAGGIGVTPIFGMVQRLNSIGASWELHYACRTRADGAFLDEIRALVAGDALRLRVNFDHEPGGKLFDLPAIVSAAPPRSHFYACGPAPMLAAFEAAAVALAPERRHIERFTAGDDVVRATDGDFEIVLARSNKRFHVPAGKPILDVLLDEGIEIAFSCMEGRVRLLRSRRARRHPRPPRRRVQRRGAGGEQENAGLLFRREIGAAGSGLMSMIPKSGCRFSDRSCSKK